MCSLLLPNQNSLCQCALYSVYKVKTVASCTINMTTSATEYLNYLFLFVILGKGSLSITDGMVLRGWCTQRGHVVSFGKIWCADINFSRKFRALCEQLTFEIFTQTKLSKFGSLINFIQISYWGMEIWIILYAWVINV